MFCKRLVEGLNTVSRLPHKFNSLQLVYDVCGVKKMTLQRSAYKHEERHASEALQTDNDVPGFIDDDVAFGKPIGEIVR